MLKRLRPLLPQPIIHQQAPLQLLLQLKHPRLFDGKVAFYFYRLPKQPHRDQQNLWDVLLRGHISSKSSANILFSIKYYELDQKSRGP